MTDIRTQLPECPLEYQIPHIPQNHSAIVIDTNAKNIDAHEKILPWTLASLINNTDIVHKGVHIYVRYEKPTKKRIQNALKNIELPTPLVEIKNPDTPPFLTTGWQYDSVCLYNINYWAFRGFGNHDIKLPIGHLLRYNWGWGVANLIHAKNTRIGTHVNDPQWQAEWRNAVNIAVYGENYKKEGKSINGYFLNENEPNWNLDTSLLQYQSQHVESPMFHDFTHKWKHLGTETLIALWLLKTHQHAYNFSDTIFIDQNGYAFGKIPQLCYMRHATKDMFKHATQHLLGAHMNISTG